MFVSITSFAGDENVLLKVFRDYIPATRNAKNSNIDKTMWQIFWGIFPNCSYLQYVQSLKFIAVIRVIRNLFEFFIISCQFYFMFSLYTTSFNSVTYSKKILYKRKWRKNLGDHSGLFIVLVNPAFSSFLYMKYFCG